MSLDETFEQAFTKASTTNKKLSPDIMLKLYAYYKQATQGDHSPFYAASSSDSVRNAFKMNAWVQVQGLSEEEAKQAYIDLVHKVI